MSILEVSELSTDFKTPAGTVRAVDGVSFSLEKGKTLGIVGESGSGKSVTCYSLLGLIPMPPGHIAGGTAMFEGNDLLQASEKDRSKIRGQKISMIFQDPMTCLNPYMKVGEQIMEPLLIHQEMSRPEAYSVALDAMKEVGIKDAETRIEQYPHEFSGGMRQRVMIAMALVTEPDILIADEPTTALDVTVQKQVLDLIKDLQRKKNTAVILVTHDLSVVNYSCDDVLVMYAGRVVEQASKEALLSSPKHAYTRSLLKSIPAKHSKDEELFTIPGIPPNMLQPPTGCAFAERNLIGDKSKCCDHRPELVELSPGHYAQDCEGCLI